MDNKKKQEFIGRITCANRSGLILIMYDMAAEYFAEAKSAVKDQNWEEHKKGICSGERIVERLAEDLDFKHEISMEFYRLYRYCMEEAAKAKITRRTEEIEHIQMVLKNLTPGIEEMTKVDQSGPMMEQVPQIVAGMTYQKGRLTEDYQEPESSRGFLA